MTSRHSPRVKPSTATPSLQRCSCGGKRAGGGECAECRKKREEPLRRAALDSQRVDEVPPIVGDVLRSPGEALAVDQREFFEDRLGQDFSRVRVHTDARATESARKVNAHAYTVGRDVVFGQGQYRPHSESGRRLLAHELTHVAQQRNVTAPPSDLRIGDDDSSAEHEAVRAADGIREAGPPQAQAAAVQRQRVPDDTKPTNVGPPLQEVPLPPVCSVIFKNGKWSWKCERLPGIGSTPEVPLDPRDIPDRLKELIPKTPGGGSGSGGPSRTFPWPPAPDTGLPPNWFKDLCKRQPKSPLCLVTEPPAKTPTPGQLTPGTPGPKPVGVFWTTNIRFEHNVPSPQDPSTGMTGEGEGSLATIIFLLNSDPTLQVRLVGHASSEGNSAQNLELSKRRAQLVSQKLREAQLWARIVDPIPGDGAAAGCTKVEFGVWACGAQKATPDEVKPEERRVDVTFLRNPPLQQGPFKLTPPDFGGTSEQ